MNRQKTAVLTLSILLILSLALVSFSTYIGDDSTVMRFGKYSISPYSFIVEQFNSTHYQSINASGYVYQSTNASAVFNNAFGNSTGKIFAKTGIYTITSPIYLGAGDWLDGEGWGNTLFVLGAECDMFRNADFRVANTPNVTISNIRMNGNRATYTNNQNCIHGEFNDSSLRYVWIDGFSGFGANLTSIGANAQHVDVIGIHIWYCTLGGMMYGGTMPDQMILDSYFICNGGAQLNFSTSVNIQVEGCHFASAGQTGATAYGIVYSGPTMSIDFKIIGNEFENFDAEAIYIKASAGAVSGIIISGNTFKECATETTDTSYVVYIYTAQYVTISGNSFRHTNAKLPKGFIFVSVCNEVTISDNVMRGNTTYGDIVVSTGTNLAITGNVLRGEAHSARGIRLSSVSNATVTGNSVRDFGEYGITIYSCDHVVVLSNIVTNNGAPQIYVGGTSSSYIIKNNAGYNYDDSAYSYVISTDGTNYYSENGRTGQVYQSTNADAILNSTSGNTTSGGTILLKNGTYNTAGITLTNQNMTHFMGEGWGTVINITGTYAFNFTTTTESFGCSFENLCFQGNGIADFGITTGGILDSYRINDLTIEKCRFLGFTKAGSVAIDLKNGELCHIQNNRISAFSTTGAAIRIRNTQYSSGNIWVQNNFIYVGSNLGDDGKGLYIITQGANDMGSIWSMANHYYADGNALGTGYNGTGIYVNASTANILIVKSLGDRFEWVQAVWAETTTFDIYECIIADAYAHMDSPGRKMFWFDTEVYKIKVRNSDFFCENATSYFFDDDSTWGSTLGYENSFIGNTFRGNGLYGDGKYTYCSQNAGLNPFSRKTTNFLVGTSFTAFGTSTAFANNTVYTIRTNDLLLTISGGTGVNITIWDPSDNVASTSDTSLSMRLIPYGYKINATWTTSITLIEFYWK
jgi:parallel beta-helix repeat protein